MKGGAGHGPVLLEAVDAALAVPRPGLQHSLELGLRQYAERPRLPQEPGEVALPGPCPAFISVEHIYGRGGKALDQGIRANGRRGPRQRSLRAGR